MDAKHLPALDGLRGFAALVVVIGHSAAFGFLPDFLSQGLGQMGVAIFFGLSGFLMAYLYCGTRLNPENLREYAVNRGARVLPLYFIVASFVCLVFILFDYSLLKVFSWVDVVGNIFLLRGSSVLWTIPVEVHFYVLFVALWYAANVGRFVTLAVLMALTQLSLLVILFLNGIDYGPILFSWLHLFLFGALIGGCFEPLQRLIDTAKHHAVFSAFGWLVLMLVVIAPPQLRRDIGIPTTVNFLDPITVGYPMLLLVCAVFVLGPFSLFKTPVLRWFGKISYSLYLLHPFVIDGVVAVLDRGARFGFPLVLGISTLLAAASFHGLERPLQRKVRAYFTRPRRQPGLS